MGDETVSSTHDARAEQRAAFVHAFAAQRESETLAKIRAATRDLPHANMQISAEQGRFMALLVRMIGAKRALEIGTFTGYSALCVVQALPPDGTLVACDVSAEWTSIGRRFWAEAGVADRIDLRLGRAGDTLAKMIDAGETDAFDFAFIDADKESYLTYYEQCLRLLRRGGLIAVDNMFMGGRVPDPDNHDPDVLVVRRLADLAATDERVDSALVSIRDGVLLAWKR